jgi:hypothetical protein
VWGFPREALVGWWFYYLTYGPTYFKTRYLNTERSKSSSSQRFYHIDMEALHYTTTPSLPSFPSNLIGLGNFSVLYINSQSVVVVGGKSQGVPGRVAYFPAYDSLYQVFYHAFRLCRHSRAIKKGPRREMK